MTKHVIPDAILAQHTAVLGKTGSGKTSTEKLIVEQVVEEGSRVCVLDTIKSDWWGITSSASGHQAGLPFKILGGPHGHVPLHSSAGKVIGQLVGSGKLPLSIVDMADFEPGGIQRFFVDFAQSLFRNMRGVVYLVIEEAHEIAPKERAGFGAENLSIHWAKKIATGARSKGIRLIVATQRVQSLHNAVLGSCESVIAHRLTTPADQKPVINWLKINADKATAEKVAQSLSSLPTGSGWMCSGEAKIFELVKFPKFKTYDNTATPTGDTADVHVKTAAVDQDELRTLIGDEVKAAEANDPRALRGELVKKTTELAALKREMTQAVAAKVAADPDAIKKAEERGFEQAKKKLAGAAQREAKAALMAGTTVLRSIIGRFTTEIDEELKKLRTELADVGAAVTFAPSPALRTVPAAPASGTAPVARPAPTPRAPAGTPSDASLGKGEKIVLAAIAQYPNGATREQLTVLTGYKRSTRDAYLQRLGNAGHVEIIGNGAIRATQSGIDALGSDFEPLPSGAALQAYWMGRLPEGEKRILGVLIERYPQAVDREEISTLTPYARSSRDAYIQRLSARMLVAAERGSVKASDILFEVAA